MKYILLALLLLTGCTTVNVPPMPSSGGAGGSGGSGGGEQVTRADGGGGASSVAASTGAGGAPACTTHQVANCQHESDVCIAGSECDTFRACYQSHPTDPYARQVCVDMYPDGAFAWATIVKCECDCGLAPSGLCDGSEYGTP